jgi:hypothetical protein
VTTLDAAWAATTADSENEDNVTPPVGTYIVRIADARSGTSKKGEQYYALDLKDDANGHKWMIYKAFTKNGQPHEGSIKSAKITLRQLGLEVASPAHLEAILKQVVGRYYAVDVKASDKINQLTGAPYLNTDVTGVASPPANVAQPVQNVAPQVPQAQVQPPQPPVQQDGMAMTAQPGYQFPAAVAGTPPTVVGQNPVAAQQAAVQQAINSPGIDDVPFS